MTEVESSSIPLVGSTASTKKKSYLKQIDELKELVLSSFQSKEHYLAFNAADYANLNSSLIKFNQENISLDFGGDLEIVFRSVLQSFTFSHQPNESSIENSKGIQFIKYTIDFTLLHPTITDNFPKILFLLIEDILEFQTIQIAKKIWKIVESLIEKITHPNVFPKGRLVVLKICNSLLRKLSKSCDTEVSQVSLSGYRVPIISFSLVLWANPHVSVSCVPNF